MSWAFEKHTDKVLFLWGGGGWGGEAEHCKELAWWEGGKCFLGGGGGVGVVCLCGG